MNLKSIPKGSHGSTDNQKRLWKVVSDYVRIRDFYEFGDCISCGKKFSTWSTADYQGGHYFPYSICKGYTKFYTDNVFGQCSYCNRGFSGSPAGATFKENIIKRYGQDTLDEISTYKNMPPQKLEEAVIIDLIEQNLELMKDLPELPEWYERATKS